MYKKFQGLAKHSIIYGVPDIIRKSVGFIMIPVYTRFLTPDEYGIMSLLMLFITFSSIVVSIGMADAFTRFYFEGKERRERNAITSTAMLFLTISVVIFGAIVFPFTGKISDILFGSIQYSFFVKISVASFILQLMRTIPLRLLVVEERSSMYATVEIITFFIAISLNIYFIAVLRLGVLGYLYSAFITAAAINIPLSIYTFARTGVRFSFKWLKRMTKYGVPLIFSGLLMVVYMQSDRLFLKYFSSLKEVGLYSLAWQFGFIISYILSPFLMARTPFILSHYKKGYAKGMFARLFTYSSALFVFISLGLAVFIQNIFHLVVGKEFFSAYKIVPVLIVAFLLRTGYYLLNIGISLTKKTKFLAYIALCGAACNILFNFLFIPQFGATGAAISKIITFFIMMVLVYAVSQKLYYIEYEKKRIVQIFILAVFLYLVSTFIPFEPFLLSVSLRGLIMMMFPLCLFFMGFLKKEELDKVKEVLGGALNWENTINQDEL